MFTRDSCLTVELTRRREFNQALPGNQVEKDAIRAPVQVVRRRGQLEIGDGISW